MPNQTDDTQLVTVVLVIIGVFVIFPMIFMGFGMMGFGPMMDGMWGDGMWGGGPMPGWMFVVGIVMQLLFLTAIVGGGYLVYRVLTGEQTESDKALEELRRAYARGELTDDEYEQRKERLERDTKSR
jgi:putative membrane protein